MRGVVKKAMADLRRRKLQAAVVGVVVLLSSLAGTLALSLVIEADAPFDHAFAQAAGGHLVYRYDMSKVTTAQVGATRHLPAVEDMTGPWLETPPLDVTVPDGGRVPLGLVGREGPGGSVDRLTLVAGRWVQREGEVVLARRVAKELRIQAGDALTPAPDQGIDALRVVGIAAAVNDFSDGWTTPAQAAAVHAPPIGGKSGPFRASSVAYYRLRNASTRAAIDAASHEITGAVPASSVLNVNSWLDQKVNADRTTSVMVPFLLAFSVFALVSAAMIIGNVVSGTVIAGYREIGIMKSIGFTPAQVAASLALQMIVPATLGAVFGILAGVAASQPFLADTAAAFDLPQATGLIVPVMLLCFASAVTLVLVSTLVPAVRAGRLSAVEAIATGSAPQTNGGWRSARLAARLPLPRPATLGIGDSVARPVRSAMTMVAILIGVATITFATGLTRSLSLVKHSLTHDQTVQVRAFRGGDPRAGTGMTDAQLDALIKSQPGTARYVASGLLTVNVDGVGDTVRLFGYRGDATFIGNQVLSGRWYRGPGEAVAPQALLDAAHARVGDTVTVNFEGRQEQLRVVGSYFETNGNNLILGADWSALTALAPNQTPRLYDIQVALGINPNLYAQQLIQATADPGVDVRSAESSGTNTAFLLIESALGGLALVLTLIAMAGVFNTVVLNTREKARDTAILRALGMTPLQVTAMVLTSVTVVALGGAALGIPLGELLHRQVLALMGQIAASTAVPEAFYAVFSARLVALLGVAGIAVALGAAFLPATWSSRSGISSVLASE